MNNWHEQFTIVLHKQRRIPIFTVNSKNGTLYCKVLHENGFAEVSKTLDTDLKIILFELSK